MVLVTARGAPSGEEVGDKTPTSDAERDRGAGELEVQLPAWIDTMARPADEGFTREMFETQVREEFSTFAWIIEGMIERDGHEVAETTLPAPWYGEYIATKPR